jgi:hypothetical protein
MGVRIDAARQDVTAAGVDNLGTRWHVQILSDGGDDAVTDQDVGALRMIVINDCAAPDDLCRHGFPPSMPPP